MTGQPTRKPIEYHGRRDPEERGRRHVVAGDRQAVLEAGDAAAGGVEVGRRLGLGGGPFRDEQRHHDEGAEHADRGPVGGLLGGLAEVGTGGVDRSGYAEQRAQGQQAAGVVAQCGSDAAHFSTAFATAAVRSSYSLFARLT
jgi:hypothetical protein